MLDHIYIPSPPLSDFVNSFRLYEESGAAHMKERILPTGTTELVINLRDDALRVFDRKMHGLLQSSTRSIICGAHSEFFVIDTGQKSGVLTVNFKPGGAFPFLGLPADELHNTCVSLDTLWGATAHEVRHQLLEAKTPAMKFHILEHFLLRHLARSVQRHAAVSFALDVFLSRPLEYSIANVTEQIGLSPRHFIHLFRQEVGMTPKRFCRVQRFQQVIHRLKNSSPVDWTDVALTCGYYDQAHFIHDFRAFSDLNPTTYCIQPGQQLNHIPLLQ